MGRYFTKVAWLLASAWCFGWFIAHQLNSMV